MSKIPRVVGGRHAFLPSLLHSSFIKDFLCLPRLALCGARDTATAHVPEHLCGRETHPKASHLTRGALRRPEKAANSACVKEGFLEEVEPSPSVEGGGRACVVQRPSLTEHHE